MAYTTINKSTDYFRNKLYVGNDTARSITFDESTNLQPDLLWIKSRSHSASWIGVDVLRGATSRFKLDTDNAASTQAQMVTAFDTNGFSLGTSSTGNGNGYNFFSNSWKANGAGSANTAGTINTTSTSANTTAGFSIIKYTGNGTQDATIGHGLSKAPTTVIIKNIDTQEGWVVGDIDFPFTKIMKMNTTAGLTTSSLYFGNVAPSATLITLGTDGGVNTSGDTYVCYAWHEVAGYSKSGNYNGNGSSDGTFVYTGFKPSWIMCKVTNTSGDWYNFNDKMTPSNVAGIYHNANKAEADHTTSAYHIDILSNGFKFRGNGGELNSASNTYMYMAFGQTMVGTNNIMATAR